jgi:hypothetical protein
VVSDWSPYVQKIMTAGANGKPVDVVFNLPNITSELGLSAALRQAGYPGLDTNPAGYSAQLIVPFTGATAYTQWATPESATQEGNAAMEDIVASLNAVGIETSKISQTALSAWFSADMFVQILKKAGKNLTPEKWAKAAAKFTYEIKDTIGPTVYPTAFAAPSTGAQLVKSDGTQWNVTQKYGLYDLVDTKTGKLIPYDNAKNKAY